MADGPPTGLLRRGLVPSDRQRQLGEEVERHEFGAPPRSRRRPQPVGRLRTFVSDLNPCAIGGPKLPLVLLGLSALLASWDDVALRILLPEMRADFGFSLQFLLTMGSILGVVAILLAPAMGYLADRVRRVWMLRVGALLANVASVVQGAAPGIPQLVVGRTIAGAGSAIREPAGFPLLTDYFPSRSRARVFAFLGFMGALGAVAGPSVAGNLGEWFGWRFTVISLGILATVVTLGFFLLKEPVRGYQDRIEMGAGEAAARRPQPPVSWGEAWRAAASITTVRRLWYATPFLQVASVGMALFLVPYFAEEFALGPQERGYIATAYGIVALVGILFAAPISDRLLADRPGRVMVALGVLMALYAASVVVLVVSHNLWLSILVGLPLGFGFVAIGPALFTLMSLVVPARTRGLGMQTVAPWQLIGMVLLPFIGRAADTWGIRQGLLLFVPVYLIGAVILASSTTGVGRDIRAARAASMADEAARLALSQGRAKMLVCRDVDVHYDGVQALFNVDFDVEAGDIVALMGTNGAGKSSLLRAIAGVQESSNGAIFFDGHDVTHAPPEENASRGIVLVPGGQGVFASLSVADNLRTAAWANRHDSEHVRKATERALALFPALEARMNQAAGTLSGGEQQMLTIAQALLARPKLLMIDELTLGLAPPVVDRLLATLQQINAQGTTIILVEQSINVALRIARRSVFMERGEIHFDGPTAELFRHPELLRSIFMARAASAAGRLAVAPSGPAASTGDGHPSQRRPQSILAASDVGVRFGGVQAVAGVSLDVAPGEIVGIIGPNGAGKSTLFDAISGLVPVSSGRIEFKGANVTSASADARARQGMGRSFQDVRLFPSLTVRDNLKVARDRRLGAAARNPLLAAAWARQAREAGSVATKRVDHLLGLFGLTEMADKFVAELSTGTRRALDLACLSAAEPELLLLDEPSSGLAQAEATELGLLLARTARETGWAMLIVEHDLALAASLCDRMVAMHLGEVIASGPPQEVLRHPAVVASYLAAPVEAVSGVPRSALSGAPADADADAADPEILLRRVLAGASVPEQP